MIYFFFIPANVLPLNGKKSPSLIPGRAEVLGNSVATVYDLIMTFFLHIVMLNRSQPAQRSVFLF